MKVTIVLIRYTHQVLQTQFKQKPDFITYRDAFSKLIIYSFPSIIGSVFEMFVEVINLIFVGHLNDPAALAGVGLGNM
jgi:Na+-driven multidrug efflux pump